MIWQAKSRPIDLSTPRVMGILNLTPDSFSDGGSFRGVSAAVEHALHMVADGADILDIGAESTRPGAQPVEPEEQVERAVPVIREIRGYDAWTPISIDTRSALVARHALEAGADIVNDVSAMSDDPGMADLIRNTGAGVVLMHMMGRPETGFVDPETQQPHVYGNVVQEVMSYLSERIAFAERHGISSAQLVIDPGFGFGKDVNDNLRLLAQLREFEALPHPLLVGVSRKRFIGTLLHQPIPTERLHGSLAAAAVAVLHGAGIIRAHDVEATARVVKMCAAIIKSTS